MTSNKRARQLARAKFERQQAAREARRSGRRRKAIIGAGAGIAVILIAVGAVAWASNSSKSTATPTSSPTASTSASNPAGVSCTAATAQKQDRTFTKPTSQKLQPGASITFDTSCGDIVVALDVKQAPKTTNAIAFLASEGWYNNNGCHRLTTEGIYVLQCGSPSLDGQGGPGFKLPDENLPKQGDNNYPAGTVAMANSGPGTSGSQIFLVYKDTTLPPNYTIFGKMTSGLDVVEYVASKGVEAGSPNPGDGPPAQPIVIETTTVKKGS